MTHLALQAVAELIRTQTMRIEYDGIPDLTVQLRAPCLLAQLASLVGVGLESGGRGIPGSRPTINVDAVDLWVEIATATATWCQQLGIDRTALRDPPPAEDDVHTTPAVGKLLRSCAADAISRGFPQIADRIAHNATAWARRIDTMLTGHTEQRAVRGAGCPDCTTIAPYPRGQIGPWAGPQPTRTITEYRDENGRQARPDAVRQASNQDLVRVALHPRPDPRAELACRPDVLQRLARRTRLRRQPRRTRLDARSSPRRPASPSRRGAVTFGRERAVTDPDLHTLAAEAPDEAPWRTGVAAGDGFIYRQAGPRPDGCDPRIGHMDTPDLARQVVEAVNGYRDRVPLADVLDALRDEGALLRWYQTHHPDKYVNLHAAGRLAGYLADRFAAPQDTDERTGSDG